MEILKNVLHNAQQKFISIRKRSRKILNPGAYKLARPCGRPEDWGFLQETAVRDKMLMREKIDCDKTSN